jgi:CheY-like chemotaxis protein
MNKTTSSSSNVPSREPVFRTRFMSSSRALAYLKGEGDFANRSRHPIPILLLLDLKLRGLDGTAVLKWIRTQSSFTTLPVIVLSSSSLTKDVDKAYRSGANSYVLKAADPNELTELMRDFSRWWLKHNVPALAP